MIDVPALLAHIKARANAQASLVAAAVLDGLATAIERGDFNVKEGDET
ncbi:MULTISPECIES: hypothetical protein [unclassified Cryobacterium]|nr:MULTISPECIES: hypothetical protein [unclassified Cryobacterium]MDY7542635.1 hypothetical protein [Cryobacterium sp. 5B3]MEB0264755.1 hypothetical protein [Cryobacterium sp. 10I5]MEB0273727.1 hypothetical protein [Cryobacterium sp. 5B3]